MQNTVDEPATLSIPLQVEKLREELQYRDFKVKTLQELLKA